MYAGRDDVDPFGEWERDISSWTAEQMVEAISEKFVRMEYIDRAVVALGGVEAVTALPARLLV